MRRIFAVTMILSICFFLVGCDGQKFKTESLNCTYTGTDNSKAEYTHTFKDKVSESDAKIKYTFDFRDYTDEQLEKLENEDFCTTLMTGLFSSGTDSCKQKIEDKKLTVAADVNIFKWASEQAGSDTIYELNIDDTKDYLEKAGFNCTIE